jgi:hypothetical protein
MVRSDDLTLSGYRKTPRLPGHRVSLFIKEIAMGYLSIMLIIWGIIVACFLVLLAYNANVTRYEEDQLFLSDTNEIEKRSQDDILKKVTRVQPYIRVFGSLSAIMTLGVMGIMSWDAWQHLR